MGLVPELENLRFTKTHEWIMVEDSIATIGITDYAQQELSDVTGVQLPEEDAFINAGDEAVTIDSVKATSPVAAPVSGTIIEINSELLDTPELINQDPYGAGWLFRIEMKDESEWDDLLEAGEYEEVMESEED